MEAEIKSEAVRELPKDKHDPVNCDEKSADFCLICFSKVDRSKLPKQDSLLSNNLNVIFLLRKLLQVPSGQLLGNFKKCGSPAFWISLCENCCQLTGQAMEHHIQILKLVNQLRSVHKIITEKIKESSVPPAEASAPYQDNKDDKKKSMQEKRFEIMNRTREFVTNYDYKTNLVNPFIEGDKLARELEEKEEESSSSSSDDSDCGGDGWQDAPVEEQVEETEEDRERRLQAYLALDIPFSKLPKARQILLEGGKWKCQHCDKEFRNSSSLSTHERAKHPAIPDQFKCDICGRSFNSRGYLGAHLYKKHKVNRAGEPIRGKSRKGKGQSSESQDNKLVEEEGKKEEDSGAAFTDMPAHQRWRLLNPLKWECQHCGRKFRAKKAMIKHENEKHLSVPQQFTCEICGKMWDTKALLLTHRRRFHRVKKSGDPVKARPPKPKPVDRDRPSCNLCGKSFSMLSILKKHVQYFHEKKFDIRCHVCGMGVYSKHNLNVHLLSAHKDDPETLKLIEEGLRIWRCDVKGCRGIYLEESRLEEHKRQRHGDGGGWEQSAEKRFTCAFCGKTFWYWGILRSHETLCELGDERPHECDVCGAKLKAAAYLRRHKRQFHPETLSNYQ